MGSETLALRFWFGLVSIGFAAFLLFEAVSHWEYAVSFSFMPHWAWATLFAINGAALLLGAITKRYSKVHLLVEGGLGVFLWVAMGITSMISQGTPGAITMSMFISVWLCIRYPTWNEE
jgi:hypothetical protein